MKDLVTSVIIQYQKTGDSFFNEEKRKVEFLSDIESTDFNSFLGTGEFSDDSTYKEIINAYSSKLGITNPLYYDCYDNKHYGKIHIYFGGFNEGIVTHEFKFIIIQDFSNKYRLMTNFNNNNTPVTFN